MVRLQSTFKRKIKKRELPLSFRLPPELDKELDRVAAEKHWTKSFLVRDILISWLTYRKASKKIEGVHPPGVANDQG